MITSHFIHSGPVRLHATTRGEPAKPALVLVHGYPDNHSVWDAVADLLAEQFYVLAYDVRGAGRSDRPSQVADYRMSLLAEDLRAVVDTLIPERPFHLAAHDWGSIQSWESVTTAALQGRILSYSTISGPCLDHMGFWMRNHILSGSVRKTTQAVRQLLSSWYVMMFQLPLLPPLVWRAGLDKLWPYYLKYQEQVTTPEFNPSQREDGAMGVLLYRANFRQKLLQPERRPAHCPVQLIVPTRDNYVGTQLFSELSGWVEHLQRQDIDATHWVLLTHPQQIARWIGDFALAWDRQNRDTPDESSSQFTDLPDASCL